MIDQAEAEGSNLIDPCAKAYPENNKEKGPKAVALAAAQSMIEINGAAYVDDNVVLKWASKWRWFVVVTVERALHNCFQQNMLDVDEATGEPRPGQSMLPKRRVTLFGSVLQVKSILFCGHAQRLQ
jgi:hypothetical protein